MELSRRQFFRCIGLSSAAAAAAPAAALEGFATGVAPQAIAISSAWPRLQVIEQAIVSTYGLIDLTGSMKAMGGLIDGAVHTAYSIAAHSNFMLGEVAAPEPKAVLMRLLSPHTAREVTKEAQSLFKQLAIERTKLGDVEDLDDLRGSYMSKLSRVVHRLNRNQELSSLIHESSSSADPLAQRVASWCEKIFSGRLEELPHDRLFNALGALHRMEVCRDGAFSPQTQRELLEILKQEGIPEAAEAIFGPDAAALLRRCELLQGEIENYITSSRSMLFPAHLLHAAKDLAASLKKHRHFAWADFYNKHFREFSSTASRWNDAAFS